MTNTKHQDVGPLVEKAQVLFRRLKSDDSPSRDEWIEACGALLVECADLRNRRDTLLDKVDELETTLDEFLGRPKELAMTKKHPIQVLCEEAAKRSVRRGKGTVAVMCYSYRNEYVVGISGPSEYRIYAELQSAESATGILNGGFVELWSQRKVTHYTGTFFTVFWPNIPYCEKDQEEQGEPTMNATKTFTQIAVEWVDSLSDDQAKEAADKMCPEWKEIAKNLPLSSFIVARAHIKKKLEEELRVLFVVRVLNTLQGMPTTFDEIKEDD